MQQLRELVARLFGGGPAAKQSSAEEAAAPLVRPRAFAEFRDPFAAGDHRRLPPEELVRYTFDAFEAGPAKPAIHARPTKPRPSWFAQPCHPKTPLYNEARRMTRLYGQVAYASGRVSPAAAENLREIWSLMHANKQECRECRANHSLNRANIGLLTPQAFHNLAQGKIPRVRRVESPPWVSHPRFPRPSNTRHLRPDMTEAETFRIATACLCLTLDP